MTKLTGSLGVRNEINVDIIGTGARGKEGKSAYEIWLDLGNEGTEQEYLASLKGQDGYTPIKGIDYFDGEPGAKGDKGDAGEPGPKGDKGDAGEPGPKGDKGEPGEKGEKGEDGTPGAKGDKGEKGDKGDKGADGYTPVKGTDYFDGAPGKDGVDGQDGAPGADGITPHIGPNGNWFVGDVDTSIKAEGQDGRDGDPLQIVNDLTTGGADKALSAEQGKVLNGQLHKPYELLETITLTEDVVSIVRTQEPDGTPYAFKAIGVVVQAEVGSVISGINVLGFYNSTRLQSGFINSVISNSNKKYGYAQIYLDWGAWTAIGSTAVNGFGWTVIQMTGYSPAQAFSVKESENPYCTQVTLQVNISGATIPTGTIIQIYGVRA